MRSRLRAMALVCAVAFSLAAVPAQARNQEARVKFESAQRAYRVGSFQEALALYEEAYRLDPRPPFLFNIGQCHRQMGNWERAIFFFNQYLDAHAKAKKTAPKNHALVLDLIRECEREQATRAKAEQEKAAIAAREEAGKEQTSPAPTVRAVEAFAADAPVAKPALDLTVAPSATADHALPASAESVTDAERPAWQRWWFWTAVGAIAVGAVAGGVWVATAPEPQPTTLGTRDLR